MVRRLGHFTDAQLETALHSHRTKAAAARAIGVPRKTFARELARRNIYRAIDPPKGFEEPGEDGFRVNGDIAEASWKGIETQEELIERCQIDETKWEPHSFQARAWPMLVGDGRIEQAVYVRCSFNRKKPDHPDIQGQRWLKKIGKKSRKVAKVRVEKTGLQLVCLLYDLHVGKKAYHTARGEKWEVDEAIRAGSRAIDAFASYAEAERVEKIILPWGQDMGNVDTFLGTTTKGTPQQSSSPIWEQREALENFSVMATDRLSEVAPVHLMEVCGNHDRLSSAGIAAYLEAWHRNNPNITFDRRPLARKYLRHGRTVLGFGHLEREVRKELHSLLQREAAQAGIYDRSHFFEFFCGHMHHLETDERQGVRVRTCPSLSPADEYHYGKGFDGCTRAADAHLICERSGNIGRRSFNIPPVLP